MPATPKPGPSLHQTRAENLSKPGPKTFRPWFREASALVSGGSALVSEGFGPGFGRLGPGFGPGFGGFGPGFGPGFKGFGPGLEASALV